MEIINGGSFSQFDAGGPTKPPDTESKRRSLPSFLENQTGPTLTPGELLQAGGQMQSASVPMRKSVNHETVKRFIPFLLKKKAAEAEAKKDIEKAEGEITEEGETNPQETGRRSLERSTTEQIRTWGARYGEIQEIVEEAIHSEGLSSLKSLSYDDRQDAEQQIRINAFLHSDDEKFRDHIRQALGMTGANIRKDILRREQLFRKLGVMTFSDMEKENKNGTFSSIIESIIDTRMENDPQWTTEQNEEIIKCRNAIAKAAEELKDTVTKKVFLFRTTTDLTFAEIAEQLHITTNLAKSRFYHSLDIVKKVLFEDEPDNPTDSL